MAAKSKVRKPSQERSRATVEAILQGASQVLRNEGLEGCTTTRVAARAGVSVGTLYQYFPNKEALFDTLIDQLLQQRAESRSRLLAAQPEDGELGPSIAILIDQLLEVHMADPILQRQLHRYEASRGFARLDQYELHMRAAVAGELRRRSDRFRAVDPELAARILVHAMTGVVERMAREDPSLLERPEVRIEVAALVAGYLGPENPLARSR